MALSRDATVRLARSLRRAKPLWMSDKDDLLVALWRRMVQAVSASGVVPDSYLQLFADQAGCTLSPDEHNRLHDAALASAG